MDINIKNRFTTQLPADTDNSTQQRQVKNACFSYVLPKKPTAPFLVHFSNATAKLLGLSEKEIQSDEFLAVFSGKKIVCNTTPFAMNYAGHQFGNWAGQLGDGRAINLFEVAQANNFWQVQLKGAGKTPYSRSGDGLAVLRSSIREFLCSEAMHYLQIPTTRALALVLTGDKVWRDKLYNGNPAYEKGAIVSRVAPSFIRFGSFELFASQQDYKNLKIVTDFTIQHYFPSLLNVKGKEKYIAFFKEVVNSTKKLILHWQRVGFVHGVMNTDNMSIHGITIDYGPYGWLNEYNPNWTPNTTDAKNKRYRFKFQPDVALWNLLQLANALVPLLQETIQLQAILEDFSTSFKEDYTKMMLEKLGLQIISKENKTIVHQLEITLQEIPTDYTIFFRNLSTVTKKDTPEIALQKVSLAFYINHTNYSKETWLYWFSLYLKTLQNEVQTDVIRKKAMNAVNPKYILRNYMAQLAIDKAEKNDFTLLKDFFELLKNPYKEQPSYEKWFAKRPDWAGNDMLSCSS